MNCLRTLAPPQKCTLSCPILDHFFGGGIPCGSITELTGEASASKTQLCLQLLLACQLPPRLGGLGGSALYVYTEGEPPLGRLRELAALMPYRLESPETCLPPSLMDGIFIEKGFDDGAALLARLQRLRPLLARGGPRRVRLLVVDSIAWLFRDMLGAGGGGGGAGGRPAAPGVGALSDRTATLFKISALLRRYADEFQLAVVVTNQVMDAMEDGSGAAAGHTAGLRLASGGREVVPALGLAWANCVNARVFLSKETVGERGATRVVHRGPPGPAAAAAAAAAGAAQPPAAPPQLRRMQIVFSPALPQSRCCYVVEQTGVRGLHPAEVDAGPEAVPAADQ